MNHIIIESVGVKTGRIIEGKALEPTISLNGNIYSAEEIDAASGLNIPLKADWEHTDEVIGTVTYTLNPQEHALYYRAEITDDKRASEITEGVHKVSIEAGVEEVNRSCSRKRCYNLVSGLTMEGIGITTMPGVQSTTLSIIESFDEPNGEHCESCPDSSLEPKVDKPDLMTKEDKPCNCKEAKENECPEGKVWDADKGECVAAKSEENLGGGPDDQTAGVDQAKPAEAPCGEGMKLDGDGKCIPEDNQAGSPVSTGPKESAEKSWIPNIDEINENSKKTLEMVSDVKSRINKLEQVDELKAMEDFKKNLYSVTKLGTGQGQSFARDDIQFVATEGYSQLKKFGGYSFDIDLSQDWVKEHFNRNKVQEAISFSGDQSNKVAAMNDVFVLPGGKYLKSIRDLVRFKEIPQGTDQIKFFKGSIPNQGTITEGSATTASTHTVTTVTLAADTVTGVAQEIKQADVEDSPFEIFDYIAQTARAEVLEHEATLVFDTTAAAATPGAQIRGDTGVSFSAGDTASVVMDHQGIAAGLEEYETQGYDTSFGNIYCVLHPRALKELRTSSNLVRLVQEGDANITKTGRLTHLYGVELIPSTAINIETGGSNDNMYSNVMGVKGHTFALGSKRDLTIDMRKIPNESAFDWAWSQRKNAVAFDPASFVRVWTSSGTV